jgi:regulator of cell morphogenesis and NO signaling
MVITTAKRISVDSLVSDIVSNDYRAAGVFRRHGIDFCCGGKWSLKMTCEMKDLDLSVIKKELEASMRTICIPNGLRFEDWDLDFLTDYIINIHHQYLRKALPEAKEWLDNFVTGHQEKFPYLLHLQKIFNELEEEMLPHLLHEEEIIFPYIRQIAHTYHSKESYAALLVRTLRKPVGNVMHHEDKTVNKILGEARQLTDHYTTPEKACVNHKVTFSKLLEIDNDLVQHLYLENNILFPKAISMEKELLLRKV